MVCVIAPTAKNIALTPKKMRNELKILPGPAQRVNFLITHRSDGDQGHIECVEERIALDNAEACGSNAQRQRNQGGNQNNAARYAAIHCGIQYRAVPPGAGCLSRGRASERSL